MDFFSGLIVFLAVIGGGIMGYIVNLRLPSDNRVWERMMLTIIATLLATLTVAVLSLSRWLFIGY